MMDKERCLSAYTLMTVGMIEKSKDKLERSMSIDSHLVHMTGLVETRDEYIRDILNGTLNYYDYEILDFSDEKVTIRLLAKVYGGSKSWWTLRMSTKYVEEDGVVKIKECKVRMG